MVEPQPRGARELAQESQIHARMARMGEAAPSPAARRWFHAGRMLAEAEMEGWRRPRSRGSTSGAWAFSAEESSSEEKTAPTRG